MLGIIIPISVMAGVFLILFASALIESRIKEKREIAFRKKEEELRKLEEKRQKRNAYMREYRKKKKEANK